MPITRWFVAACLAALGLICGQAIAPPVTPRYVNPWVSVAQPNVPADPLEVAGNALPVRGVEQRALAVKLLATARDLSNVRRGPYDLKTTFTTQDGAWQREDSSNGRNTYRWTVQGPSYSAVNLFAERVIYSNQPATGMPLRVAQVHSAIFGRLPVWGPQATLRLASGTLNGTPVTCVLVSHMFNAKPVAGPRRWEEYESCMDPASGLLMSSSPVPGLYVLYDYANAKHLGDVVFPGKFTITEAGQAVVEAQVVSLTTPANPDAALYTPTGLTALGVGFPLTMPWRMQETIMTGTPSGNPTSGQFVVMRGMVSPDGTVSDVAVLASSDAGLNEKALQRATQPHRTMAQDPDSGATPESHEALITTLFVTN